MHPDVLKEIARLRNADEAALDALCCRQAEKRVWWFEENRASFSFLDATDPVGSAYALLLRRFGIGPDEAPIVLRSHDEMVFHSMNFCPTLEACKILGLDTRFVCRHLNERSTQALVALVDPRLGFARNYDMLRPYAPYCEERIFLPMKNIVVVPYNPNWPHEFEKIKSELAVTLQDSVLSIEHVGSTSVPGLWAKPIIDIDIVIHKEKFDIVKTRLGSIGYVYEGDLGIVGREAFKYEDKPHLAEHHLYVCDKDADELKRHLALRDFLRGNKEYRDKYSNVKIQMAEKYPHDIDGYLDGKQPVILEIYGLCGLDTTYKKLMTDTH